jgi:adenine-specific DNA-methyltransferase
MDLKAFLSSTYNSQTFEAFIQERFYGVDIYDSTYTDDYLSESEKKSIDAYRFLGKAELDDGKEIGFFEFKSKNTNIENKRVGYNAILKKLAYDEYLDGAIATFYHPDGEVWRLSFVGFEYDEGKAKVTNLKRFTYVLGEGIPTKTPLAQLKNLKYPNLNEIEQAFSVEAVTDEFYKSYKALFESINEELNPQKAIFSGDNETIKREIRKFSRKLLGRITFMYFLQKKGWLGVEKNWGDGDRNFLQNIFKECKSNFYDKCLKPLFFTALNQDNRINDSFELFGRNFKIPFLNGGLFTKESYDREEIILSNELFEKIFDTFNQYNFTIIEDLPHDSEVAIDPEMLGRVFENLIEENYRKGKGAFYTPREIVHYMCKQSIIMYLSNHFDKEHMESLVNDEVTDDNYIKKHATDIKDKLLQMKVLDPAIGSGAFPMGVLHEMVQIIGNLNKADHPSKEKKLIIENSIYGVDIDGSAVDIAKLRFWLSIIVDEEKPFPLPNLAFKIMQGNSLIETIDGFSPIPEDIYEQKETKPVSLFEDAEQSLFDETKFDQLRDNIHDFYNACNTAKKKSLEQKIKSQIQEIVCGYIDIKENELQARTTDFDNTQIASSKEKLWNEMDRLQNSITKARNIIGDILTNNFQTTELFLYKLWFGEIIKEGGFDVIIGNPPYVGEKGNKEVFRLLQHEFKNRYQKNSDLFYFFFMKSIDLLKENGVLGFITTNYFLTADGASQLRREFHERTSMLNIINFNEMKIFKSALGQHNVITVLKKTTNDIDTNIINVLEPKDKFQDIFISNEGIERFQIKSHKIFNGKNDYMRVSQYGFMLENIFTKMTEQSLFLNDICSINKGFHSGCDKVTKSNLSKAYNIIPDDIALNDGIFILNEEEHQTIMPEKELIHKCYKNSDIEKYISKSWKQLYVLWTNKDTDIDKYPNVKKHLERYRPFLELKREYQTGQLPWYAQHWSREYDVFTNSDKIVFPYRAKSNIFSYSNTDFFASEDVLYLRQKNKKFHMKYLLALLNSKLYYTWLYYRGKRKGETLELYVTPISEIPIKNISSEKQKIFVNLVEYIIWLKTHKKAIDSYVDNEHITKLFEDVIDAMVLELYFGEEMQEAGFDFIAHATALFSPIENLSDSDTKDVINNAYQALRDKDNSIRNDLQLLPIRVPIVAPILESI